MISMVTRYVDKQIKFHNNNFVKSMDQNLFGNIKNPSTIHQCPSWHRDELMKRKIDSFSNDELTNFKEYLIGITGLLRDSQLRNKIESEDIAVICLLCQKLISDRLMLTSMVNKEKLEGLSDNLVIEVITELLRVLRNACAACPDNQLSVNQFCEVLLISLCELIDVLLTRENSSHRSDVKDFLPLFRASIQFSGNAVTGCPANSPLFWKHLSSVHRLLLSCDDAQLSTYTSMMIYNSLDVEQNINHLIGSESGLNVIILLIERVQHIDCEWSLFTLQKLITRSGFLTSIWSRISSLSREFLLEVMSNSLRSESVVHVDNLLFISKHFYQQVHETPDQVPSCVGVSLECLCLATSQSSVYSALKDDKQLILSSLDLLRRLHIAMPPKSSIKSHPKPDMSSSAEVSGGKLSVSDEMNSCVGVKRRLVQLLANLVYQHRDNQDAVREANGISLILEQTQIDDDNPMIQQCAVLAARNLCEGNEENQRQINEMRLEGVADDVDWLNRAGVNASMVGDKIVVTSCAEL